MYCKYMAPFSVDDWIFRQQIKTCCLKNTSRQLIHDNLKMFYSKQIGNNCQIFYQNNLIQADRLVTLLLRVGRKRFIAIHSQ